MLASAEVAVDRAVEGVSQLPSMPKDHPWFGTNIDAQSPFDLDRLNATLNTTLAKVKDLASQMKQVSELIGDDRAPSVSDALATIKALRHVAAAPEGIRDTLINPAWERDLALLERSIDEGQRLAASINAAEGPFRDEAWPHDTTKMLVALRADGASFFRQFSRRYFFREDALVAQTAKGLFKGLAFTEIERMIGGNSLAQQLGELAQLEDRGGGIIVEVSLRQRTKLR